jgi:uncharacterized protein DUF3108
MRRPLLFAGIILLFLAVCAGCAGTGTPGPASSAAAALCKEPVVAPQYQVGEKFTWNYASGKQRVWEVTGVEGNLAQIKWSDLSMVSNSEKEGVYFLDPDWVIQKAISKQGEVILPPNPRQAFMYLGLKILDFPLQIGKSWSVAYRGTNLWGYQREYVVQFKVVACEEVSTPAGKFPAVKIESYHTSVTTMARGSANRWYAPDAKNVVKFECVPNEDYWTTMPPDYELIGLELKESVPRTSQ